MRILRSPHTCQLPPGGFYVAGTVVECDTCGRRWVRNHNHPQNVYPLWRRKLLFGRARVRA